jgi:putative DNA primase/helicase
MVPRNRKNSILQAETSPKTLPVADDKIPPEMAKTRRWIGWRWQRPKDRWTKVPVSLKSGKPIDAANTGKGHMTLAEFSTIKQSPNISGLGFTLGDGFAGIDLDNCRDPETGELAGWAQAIIAELGSYTEVSPTGTGVKVFGLASSGDWPEKWSRKHYQDGEFEVYTTGRYFCVTGQHIEGTPAELRPLASGLAKLAARFNPSDSSSVWEEAPVPSQWEIPNPGRPGEWQTLSQLLAFTDHQSNGPKIRRLAEGDPSDYNGDHSRADAALCSHLAFYLGKDAAKMDQFFRESRLMRDKWDEKHSRDGRTYGQMTIDKAIETTTNVFGDRSSRGAGTTSNNGTSRTTSTSRVELDLVCMADVEPCEVPWLWTSRFPLGRISLLVGRPGCGKTFLTADIAARVSRGSEWPDGSGCAPHGSVLMLNAEDDPADTLAPRLIGAGADLDKVYLLRAAKLIQEDGQENSIPLDLSNLVQVERALEQIADCRLLILDPIGSYLGGRTDAHRDTEVRAVLAPLVLMAERRGIAVLLVAHTRKAEAPFKDDTVLGSRAFTGLARAVWHLEADADDPERRRKLLMPGKSNLALAPKGMAFRIVPTNGRYDGLCWEPDEIDAHADDFQPGASGNPSKPGPRPEKREACRRWLEELLADGPMLVNDIKAEANEAGFAAKTLRDAADEIPVERNKSGFRDASWSWGLPRGEDAQDTTDGQDAQDDPDDSRRCPNSDEQGHLRENAEENGQETPRNCEDDPITAHLGTFAELNRASSASSNRAPSRQRSASTPPTPEMIWLVDRLRDGKQHLSDDINAMRKKAGVGGLTKAVKPLGIIPRETRKGSGKFYWQLPSGFDLSDYPEAEPMPEPTLVDTLPEPEVKPSAVHPGDEEPKPKRPKRASKLKKS